ncbi:hypothetical protein, partial [Pseudomonas qingdaonensis]|uniref:hypothetical protein n=1 Tax=Pseudomonas qingdaonensis TaxID=2056231 RepID=UPI001F1EDD7F
MMCIQLPRRLAGLAPLVLALALAGCSQQPAQPLASSELGRPLANVQPGPTSLERHGLQARVEPQRPTPRA